VKTPLVDKQIADQAKAHNISPQDVVRDVMLVHQARKEVRQGRGARGTCRLPRLRCSCIDDCQRDPDGWRLDPNTESRRRT